jgi:hypothetical protein
VGEFGDFLGSQHRLVVGWFPAKTQPLELTQSFALARFSRWPERVPSDSEGIEGFRLVCGSSERNEPAEGFQPDRFEDER